MESVSTFLTQWESSRLDWTALVSPECGLQPPHLTSESAEGKNDCGGSPSLSHLLFLSHSHTHTQYTQKSVMVQCIKKASTMTGTSHTVTMGTSCLSNVITILHHNLVKTNEVMSRKTQTQRKIRPDLTVSGEVI